jgi:hypothetical protein
MFLILPDLGEETAPDEVPTLTDSDLRRERDTYLDLLQRKSGTR